MGARCWKVIYCIGNFFSLKIGVHKPGAIIYCAKQVFFARPTINIKLKEHGKFVLNISSKNWAILFASF